MMLGLQLLTPDFDLIDRAYCIDCDKLVRWSSIGDLQFGLADPLSQ